MNSNSVEILLVEDNPSDAELTIRELKKNQLANNLVHVRNGQEALDFLFGITESGTPGTSPMPKVILLDIQMPKLNGIEVLQRLKENPRTKNIPVVILTSSKEHPDVQRCYDLGANSYIVKPVDFDGFMKSIRELGFYWLLLNNPPH